MIIPVHDRREWSWTIMKELTMTKVSMIKIPALAGRIVKLGADTDDRVGKVPFYFRVDHVRDADGPANVGRLWWIYGQRVRSDGRVPVRQSHPVQFVSPKDILAVR